VAAAGSRTAFWQRVGQFLSWQWWAGLGVIVAIVLAALGYWLSSTGSSTSIVNNVQGTCNAAGVNNTLKCGTGQ
jgi:hypothetical protein